MLRYCFDHAEGYAVECYQKGRKGPLSRAAKLAFHNGERSRTLIVTEYQ